MGQEATLHYFLSDNTDLWETGGNRTSRNRDEEKGSWGVTFTADEINKKGCVSRKVEETLLYGCIQKRIYLPPLCYSG